MPREHRFRNWSNTVEFWCREYECPRDTDDVQALVHLARARNGQVRVKGAGHSFSQIVTTSDLLIDLRDQDEVFELLPNSQVRINAGMKLERLIKRLKDAGLGLANMGSVTEQSFAGAMSTGTHGTGLGFPAMPTQVVGLKLVDGTGQLRVLDATTPDELKAARLSMGLFGIITEITLQARPHYDLDYEVHLCPFEAVIDDIDALNAENERMLLWWRIPHLPQDKIAVVTKNPAGADRASWFDGIVDVTAAVGDAVLDRVLGRELDELVHATAGISLDDECRFLIRRTGPYEEMLTIPLLPVYHRECEYALPAEAASHALRQVRAVLDEADVKLTLPIEVRFAAADDDPISPAFERDTCWIGFATLDNATEVFERVEPIMKDLGGRPHWGKHFNLTRTEVEAMYPKHGDFVALRRQFDPGGLFLNTLLRRLFE